MEGYDSDSVVELRFFYVEEYEGGVLWEEGVLKVPCSSPLQNSGMYPLHHKSVWRCLP